MKTNRSDIKVGDLVCFQVCKMEKSFKYWDDPKKIVEMQPPIRKTVARRVLKVCGDHVYVNLNGQRTSMHVRSIRHVF